jgi:hypothetical protein
MTAAIARNLAGPMIAEVTSRTIIDVGSRTARGVPGITATGTASETGTGTGTGAAAMAIVTAIAIEIESASDEDGT